jgi:DNA-binding NarL/FixJ family response regulator
MSETIRILLADDHPIVRQGLRTLLRAYPDTELVAEAADGGEAVRKAVALQPDVVIMDLKLPVMDGVAATREILRQCPAIRIIVLTSFAEDRMAIEAIKAGASGFLLKDADTEQLIEAIRVVQRGGRVLDPTMASIIMSKLRGGSDRDEPAEPLTAREIEVLRLVASGRSNKEIAAELNLALPTVTSHLRNILDKLNVQNRTQAAIYALEHHIV